MENIVPVVFKVGGLTVLPFWALMVVLPRAHVTARVLRSPLAVAGPAALYAMLVVPLLATLLPAVARPELPRIAGLLGTPVGATIAWMHFLALDLLAGRWLFLEARARGLPAAVTSPLLVLTLLFAPLGLLAALAVFSRPGTAFVAWAGAAWRRLARAHRPLALLTAGSAMLLVASLVLGLVDHRQVTGAPVWLKPAKFAAAVLTAAATLAWIIGQMRGVASRRVRFAGTAIAALAALELVLITIAGRPRCGQPFQFRHPVRRRCVHHDGGRHQHFLVRGALRDGPGFPPAVRDTRPHVGDPAGAGGRASRGRHGLPDGATDTRTAGVASGRSSGCHRRRSRGRSPRRWSGAAGRAVEHDRR